MELNDKDKFLSILITEKPVFPEDMGFFVYYIDENEIEKKFSKSLEDFCRPGDDINRILSAIKRRTQIPISFYCERERVETYRKICFLLPMPLSQKEKNLNIGTKQIELRDIPSYILNNDDIHTFITALGEDIIDKNMKNELGRQFLYKYLLGLQFPDKNGLNLFTPHINDPSEFRSDILAITPDFIEWLSDTIANKYQGKIQRTQRLVEDEESDDESQEARGESNNDESITINEDESVSRKFFSAVELKQLILRNFNPYPQYLKDSDGNSFPFIVVRPTITIRVHVLENGSILLVYWLAFRQMCNEQCNLKKLLDIEIQKDHQLTDYNSLFQFRFNTTNIKRIFQLVPFYILDYTKGGPQYSDLHHTFLIIGEVMASTDRLKLNALEFLRDKQLESDKNQKIIENAEFFVKIKRNRKFFARSGDKEYYIPLEFLLPTIEFGNVRDFEKLLKRQNLNRYLTITSQIDTPLKAILTYEIGKAIKDISARSEIPLTRIKAIEIDKYPVFRDQKDILRKIDGTPVRLEVINDTINLKFKGPKFEEFSELLRSYGIKAETFFFDDLDELFIQLKVQEDDNERYIRIPAKMLKNALIGESISDIVRNSPRSHDYKIHQGKIKALDSAFTKKLALKIAIIGPNIKIGTQYIGDNLKAFLVSTFTEENRLKTIMSEKLQKSLFSKLNDRLSNIRKFFRLNDVSDVEIREYFFSIDNKEGFVGNFIGLNFGAGNIEIPPRQYVEKFKEALGDNCNIFIIMLPRRMINSNIHDLFKAVTVYYDKPIKIYDNPPRQKSAWLFGKHNYDVLYQFLLDVNEMLGGKNFELMAVDYSSKSGLKKAKDLPIITDDPSDYLKIATPLPFFLRHYNPKEIKLTFLDISGPLYSGEYKRLVSVVSSQGINDVHGEIIIRPNEADSEVLPINIADDLHSIAENSKLLIILRDNYAIDEESVKKILDRLEQLNNKRSVLFLEMIKSGTPQGFKLSMRSTHINKESAPKRFKLRTLDGGTIPDTEAYDKRVKMKSKTETKVKNEDFNLKVVSPAICGLGVDDTVYSITQDIPLYHGLWKALGIRINSFNVRGEIMKYIEEYSPKQLSRDEAILRNIMELIHLISRDSGHITNPETTKIPPMMNVAHEIARLLSHSDSPFYHFVVNHSTAEPIRTKLVYFR